VTGTFSAKRRKGLSDKRCLSLLPFPPRITQGHSEAMFDFEAHRTHMAVYGMASSLSWDLAAALLAITVRAIFHALQGILDLFQGRPSFPSGSR